ncbi:MAG: hypothetical protein JXA04_11580 [Gammaproteobacteria bacterium]|nr:hypothetical protein [Gammaproteobacteria bacterium]
MNKTSYRQYSISKLLFTAMCLLWLTGGWAQSGSGWRWYQPREPEAPKWSLELKYGDFEPELEDFKTFYGEETTNHKAIAVGYKLLRAVEIGVEYGQMHNVGVGDLPLNGGTGGEVDFTVNPAHAYLLLRGIWGEDQTCVPYYGGGITRVAYQQKIPNQPSRSGNAEGKHRRYGLQFLLDHSDISLASEMETDYGTNNTYLFIEKHHYEADVEGIELGGETVFVGLLFEF